MIALTAEQIGLGDMIVLGGMTYGPVIAFSNVPGSPTVAATVANSDLLLLFPRDETVWVAPCDSAYQGGCE